MNRARLNKTTNEENMSEEKKQKLVPLQIVIEAATLDTESGKVEVAEGLDKAQLSQLVIEQLVKEIGALQNKLKNVEEHLEKLRQAKPTAEVEEDKGEQL